MVLGGCRSFHVSVLTFLETVSGRRAVSPFSTCFLSPEHSTAAVSDERISLMNQVVSGIRAVKMHAWEDEYGRKIKNVRR